MNLSNPNLATPQWMWLAVLAPLGFAVLCAYAAAARRRQLNALAEPELQPRLLRSHSPLRRVVKQVLIGLTLVAIGFALARPQWGVRTRTGELHGEDIMVVLDCSKSMLATDVAPNRLIRAKLAILEFLERRPGGRVGLIAFAGQAFVQCPLTFDYDAFRECLLAVDEKAIPVQGTDLARALDEASSAMEKDARRKVMILVTDGEDLEKAGVQKALELAKTGVIVYAVGVGTREGKEIEAVANPASPEFVRDNRGQVVTSRLDEDTLRAIASATGGGYEPLGGIGQGLIRIRERIESGLDRPRGGNMETVGVDRFYWAIAAALGLMVVESLIGTRRRMGETAAT